MQKPTQKSLKILNDPIYGFITIDDELIFELLEHPYFQRLRRISQLGLTNLVYSGANHSRFQHALGAMNLMKSAISIFREKGFEISKRSEQAAKVAILLHDIGHGPYSHALEKTIAKGVTHEQIGLSVMNKLNEEKGGALTEAISIYRGTHPDKYLHQLVSSQLDTDRLDYLKRDSFFTGVSEGAIGSERLIKMMTIHEGELAIEAKGIYSLEKFLVARRLMYWQVYLHKTVVSAELLLMQILLRAMELLSQGKEVNASSSLKYFLNQEEQVSKLDNNEWLEKFMLLDDFDVMSAIKQWCSSDDTLLANLCTRLVERKLFKMKLLDEPVHESDLTAYRKLAAKNIGIDEKDSSYVVFENSVSNSAYESDNERISILFKDGSCRDISEASSFFQFASPKQKETKQYLYYPAEISVQ